MLVMLAAPRGRRMLRCPPDAAQGTGAGPTHLFPNRLVGSNTSRHEPHRTLGVVAPAGVVQGEVMVQLHRSFPDILSEVHLHRRAGVPGEKFLWDDVPGIWSGGCCPVGHAPEEWLRLIFAPRAR